MQGSGLFSSSPSHVIYRAAVHTKASRVGRKRRDVDAPPPRLSAPVPRFIPANARAPLDFHVHSIRRRLAAAGLATAPGAWRIPPLPTHPAGRLVVHAGEGVTAATGAAVAAAGCCSRSRRASRGHDMGGPGPSRRRRGRRCTARRGRRPAGGRRQPPGAGRGWRHQGPRKRGKRGARASRRLGRSRRRRRDGDNLGTGRTRAGGRALHRFLPLLR